MPKYGKVAERGAIPVCVKVSDNDWKKDAEVEIGGYWWN